MQHTTIAALEALRANGCDDTAIDTYGTIRCDKPGHTNHALVSSSRPDGQSLLYSCGCTQCGTDTDTYPLGHDAGHVLAVFVQHYPTHSLRLYTYAGGPGIDGPAQHILTINQPD